MGPLAEAAFDIDEADTIALYRFTFRRSPIMADAYRKNWRAGIIAGLLLASVSAAPLYFLSSDPAMGLRRAALAAGAWVLVWPYYAYRNLTRRAFERRRDETAAKWIREGKVPFRPGPARYIIYPGELVRIEETSQTANPWSAVKTTIRETDALYIELSDGTVMRVPWRAFASRPEGDRFAGLIEQLGLQARGSG
jgi:hypothetical protein